MNNMPGKSVEDVIGEVENLMRTVQKAFHSASSDFLEGLDIAIQQFIVMDLIYNKECPKMGDLAAEIGVSMSNMTAMTDRLIEHEYVQRKDDPEDRRVVRVCLTSRAKEIMKKAIGKKRKNLEILLGKISESDREGLVRILGKMSRAMAEGKGAVAK